MFTILTGDYFATSCVDDEPFDSLRNSEKYIISKPRSTMAINQTAVPANEEPV